LKAPQPRRQRLLFRKTPVVLYTAAHENEMRTGPVNAPVIRDLLAMDGLNKSVEEVGSVRVRQASTFVTKYPTASVRKPDAGD
jgi:hypothetical protein